MIYFKLQHETISDIVKRLQTRRHKLLCHNFRSILHLVNCCYVHAIQMQFETSRKNFATNVWISFSCYYHIWNFEEVANCIVGGKIFWCRKFLEKYSEVTVIISHEFFITSKYFQSLKSSLQIFALFCFSNFKHHCTISEIIIKC